MGFIGHLQEIRLHTIMAYFFKKEDPRERKIIISSRPPCSSQAASNAGADSSSLLFNALLHRIKNIDCDTSGIIEMCEIGVKTSTVHQRKTISSGRRHRYGQRHGHRQDFSDMDSENDMAEESKKRTNLIVSQSQDFKLDKNVYGNVKISCIAPKNDKRQNDIDYDYDDEAQEVKKEFEITVKSQVLNMNDLRLLIQKWVQEYLEYMEPIEELYFYQQISDCSFSEFLFESSKNFSNLFFPEKEMLIDQLDHFLHNEVWYKEKGLPYTLGFLFHGEPGCGKTSTIKAIANYAKRHIVCFSLKNVKNKKDLVNIFYKQYLNNRSVPIRKRLYVLEDIDCSEMEDLVRERSAKTSKVMSNQNTTGDSNLDMKLDELTQLVKDKDVRISDPFKSKLTMADVLETLDGVMEIDGRMLIITTNYPEKLDAALTRPGRIDIQLKFGKCTSNVLMQMYEHFYSPHQSRGNYDKPSKEIWPNDFDKTSLPSNQWTPAQATQILIRNIHIT